MPYAAENDPLCYPGTTVLINLLDITDPQLLEEAELAFFLTRAEEPPAGALDLDHYLALHRHLFQDVYAWAGQIRTSRIGKAGNWFCYPEYIEPELHRVFAELGDIERLQSMGEEFFAAHIAPSGLLHRGRRHRGAGLPFSRRIERRPSLPRG